MKINNSLSLITLTLATSARAQYNGGFGGRGGNGNPGGFRDAFATFDPNQWNRVVIAHATVAALVWVILMPTGAILMRLNLKSPWIPRIHAIWQIFSFFAYVAAVGMGIWLIRALPFADFWDDPHPRLGLALLGLTIIQPFFGFIHHSMFKKNATKFQSGEITTSPGRTIPGYIHLWLGRCLIILGMINGGLGIRLANTQHMQTQSVTNKAAIGYGVVAGVMFLLYVGITIAFEVRRRGSTGQIQQPQNLRMKNNLPTYNESQNSEDSLRQQQQQQNTRYE